MSDSYNPYSPPGTEAWKEPATAAPSQEGFTAQAMTTLKKTRPWVLFLAIIRLVGVGFWILYSLVMMGILANSTSQIEGFTSSSLVGMIPVLVIGLPFFIVEIVKAVYLLKKSGAIQRFVSKGITGEMEQALEYNRKFWKVEGVLIIIVICLGIAGFIVGILFSILAATGSIQF